MSEIWTDNAVEILKRGWEDGLSGSEIAAKLPGKWSRSAVCGKIHRMRRNGELGPIVMGEPKAAPPKVSRASTSCVRLPKKRRPVGAPMFPTEPTLNPVKGDDAIPEAQRKQLVDLTDACCHWPVGDPGTPGFFFCGGVAVEGLPYCAGHCKRAYAGFGSTTARRDRPLSLSANRGDS